MHNAITILVADDDVDDRLLIQDAFNENSVSNPLVFVNDGEELLDYLHRRGSYEHLRDTPLPGVVLLDLNMPKKDGRTALKEIKADETLRRIPIVVLTTSKTEEDIVRTYGLGVSSFITKPVTFQGLCDVVKALSHYWFEIVALPPECRSAARKHALGAAGK
ncbi:MAG: response regulator [Alphaproteobacteria bacterium]|nr:response regulator [Alphaproteobacteria bacterium]